VTGDLDRTRRWMTQGRDYFQAVLATIPAQQLSDPSSLPGWTGKHIVAHVAFNARALGRLAHWARTGNETPMYTGPAQRDAEIAAGASANVEGLRAMTVQEQSRLEQALSQLTEAQWASVVTTAQGRRVPATAIPWLRARELWIHATDLQHGTGFSEFPSDFLDALITDVLTRRRTVHGEPLHIHPTDRPDGQQPAASLPGVTTRVEGRTADLARWLTGRGTTGVQTHDGTPLPLLTPWL
jgi:maleylpyruvate isomerase